MEKLIEWFERTQRKLYWREHPLNDFQWLILEILLRRSKAEQVDKISPVFFMKYKNAHDIQQATTEELAEDIRHLGYNNKRAIIIKEVASCIIEKYKGVVPVTFRELLEIKHIGSYIASAFLCFRKNESIPCVDANVIRIISRFYGIELYGDNREDTIVYSIIKELIPKGQASKFHYALLDLGGLVCTPKKPACDICPIEYACCKCITGKSDFEYSSFIR